MVTIQMPLSDGVGMDSYELEGNLVIVGSNGSGKSRFGAAIEQNNPKTKRISAQRYLQMEERVQPQDYETAINTLAGSHKNQAPITPQNDFQQVLVSLFAEQARRNEDAVKKLQEDGTLTNKQLPSSVKDKVIEVWNFVFPHRPITLEKERVSGIGTNGRPFAGTQMSDGEKVGLYLIAQVLLAENSSILIIDEPELHLHKALMVRLWNKLEEYRSDCTFVYITHDLDFAVGKLSTKTIWIKTFVLETTVWFWEEIDNMEPIPNDLYLQILGSKKHILFVEGLKGSLDQKLYQAYYDNFTVIPRESCDKVIESVKGLRANSHLHNKEIYGLIDPDFKNQAQLESLESQGVFALKVNKIENVFLVPEIVDMVCAHLNKTGVYGSILERIRSQYKLQKDRIKFFATKGRIHRFLGESFASIKTEQDLELFKRGVIGGIESVDTEMVMPDENGDIVEILKYYPHKGLIALIQIKLGLKKDAYRDVVFNFFTNGKRTEVIEVLSKYLPEIK